MRDIVATYTTLQTPQQTTKNASPRPQSNLRFTKIKMERHDGNHNRPVQHDRFLQPFTDRRRTVQSIVVTGNVESTQVCVRYPIATNFHVIMSVQEIVSALPPTSAPAHTTTTPTLEQVDYTCRWWILRRNVGLH